MKSILFNLCLIIIFLFGIMDIYAGNGSGTGPPSPEAKGAIDLVPPPSLPIDENVYIAFSIAILFGIHTMYKNNLKTKKPI
jgi:hypothetical protein